MKVLLVQAYQGREEATGSIFPIGLCYLATALERHEVQIYDPNVAEDPYGGLSERMRRFIPDIVGLSIRNIDTLNRRDIFYYFKTVKPTVQLIKSINPAIRVMVGGPGFSIFASDIMKKVPEIDYGVYLEGEETAPRLLEHLDEPEKVPGVFYRRSGEVKFTGIPPLPDFKKLPIPRRDLTEIKKYKDPVNNIGIATKRGCPLRCVYCSYPFLNGERLRLREPSHVVDEIEYLIDNFGINKFFFVDGIFNLPQKHAMAICQEIIDRKLNVEWRAWAEIKSFTDEFVSIAEKAGCKGLPFSPDGASDKTLSALGKGITVKDLNTALSVAKRHKNISTSFGFFCMPPGQTFTGLLQTIFYYTKINLMLFGRGGASMGWIRIEPETEIHRIAIEEGVINQETDLLPDLEEDLDALYYTPPSMKYGDKLVLAVLFIINRMLKPMFRSFLKGKGVYRCVYR